METEICFLNPSVFVSFPDIIFGENKLQTYAHHCLCLTSKQNPICFHSVRCKTPDRDKLREINQKVLPWLPTSGEVCQLTQYDHVINEAPDGPSSMQTPKS